MQKLRWKKYKVLWKLVLPNIQEKRKGTSFRLRKVGAKEDFLEEVTSKLRPDK